MKGKRRQHSADLKLKMAVSAIHGGATVQDIASRYESHPALVAKWNKGGWMVCRGPCLIAVLYSNRQTLDTTASTMAR